MTVVRGSGRTKQSGGELLKQIVIVIYAALPMTRIFGS